MTLKKLLVAVLAILLTGCGAATPTKSQTPSVVTTTPILADLVRQVGGDRVSVKSIVPAGADPHTFEPSLRTNRDIAYADAAFSNYLMLEPHSVIKTLDSTLPDVPNISIAEESTKYGAEVIPLVESSHLDALWLGLRLRGDSSDRSSEAQLQLAGVEGPGQMFGYVTGTFGKPERFFESDDANGGRPVLLPVGAHTHMSWAFTKPGKYVATFAVKKDGSEVVRQNVTFAVGVQPEAGQVIDIGHVDVTADLEKSSIYLLVDEEGGGETTQREIATDEAVLSVPSKTLQEIPAGASYRFLGSPGDLVYQLPQAVLGAHVHGEIDPHMWLSVPNVKAYIRTIADTLCRISPSDQEYFRANEREYLARLDRLDEYVTEKVSEVPKENRNLVTTHDGYAYLAKRYGLKIAGYVSANSSIEPSMAERQRLTQTLFDLKTPAVFVEPYVMKSTSVLHQVAEEQDIKVCTIYSDTLDDRVSTYEDLMRFNADQISSCLSKEK